MFGFNRLATASRGGERAVETGSAEAPKLTDRLRAAIEATREQIDSQVL